MVHCRNSINGGFIAILMSSLPPLSLLSPIYISLILFYFLHFRFGVFFYTLFTCQAPSYFLVMMFLFYGFGKTGQMLIFCCCYFFSKFAPLPLRCFFCLFFSNGELYLFFFLLTSFILHTINVHKTK